MGQFRRREFLVAAGALCATRFVSAQTGERDRVRIIGYLSPDAVNPKVPSSAYASTKALRKLGWVEGRNVVIERRFAAHDRERLAGLAQELASKRVDLIVAYTGSAAVAAARATRTIPIVFISIPFPVEQGLIDSFARPGRNVTGTSIFLDGVGTKRFEFLREIMPAVKRVYVVLSLEFLETVDGPQFDRMASLRAEAERFGFDVEGYVIRDSRDVEAALSAALAWGAQAIFPAPGLIAPSAAQRILKFVLEHRLPSMFTSAGWAEGGGLLSYGPSRAETVALTDRAMEYVDRILRGDALANLPVQQPAKFELVINMKTAKALGLTIPKAILVRADRVIE